MKPPQPTLLGKLPFFSETDSFVDSLCPGVAVATCTPKFTACHSSDDPKHRVQVGMDVLQLLGCSASPGDEELEEIWAFRTAQVLKSKGRKPPVRASINERMKKIHRMRMERLTESRPTRHGLTFGGSGHSQVLLSRAHTMGAIDTNWRRPKMDPNDPLSEFIGKGLAPNLPPHDETPDGEECFPLEGLGEHIRPLELGMGLHFRRQQPWATKPTRFGERPGAAELDALPLGPRMHG